MTPLLLEGRKKIEISNPSTLEDAIRFFQGESKSSATASSSSAPNNNGVNIHLSIRIRELLCQECHPLDEDRLLDFIKLVTTTTTATADSTSVRSTMKHIVSIHIDPTMIERSLGSSTMQQVSETLGRIPTLRFLTWDVNPQAELPNPVDCLRNLAHLLLSARKLERLQCKGVWFGGTTKDFAKLANSLSEHPTLNLISFHTCQLADERQTLDDINPVLLAFSSIPQLQLLKLGCWAVPSVYTLIKEFHGGGAAEQAHLYPLSKVFSRSALRSVHIRSDALVCVASVKDCIRVEHLKVASVGFERSESQFLADILSSSHQLLETLELSLDAGIVVTDIASHAYGVMRALQTNAALKGLRFSCLRLSNGLGIVSLLQTMLVSVLENGNTTLCHVEFSGISFRGMYANQVEMQGKMNHYLKLNELGRGDLCEMYNSNHSSTHWKQRNDTKHTSMATTKKWVDTLIAAKGDVPILYYFLSQNPSLCCRVQNHVGKVVPPTKRRRM